MKSNNLAALLAVALIFCSSCHLFRDKQASSANPLLGNWKIDSIAPGSDSSGIGILLIAMTLDDSAAYDLQFDKDTITLFSKDSVPDKMPYTYIDSTHQVVLQDSSDERFVVTRLNDSTAALQAKDSSIFFLKKR